jgi:Putative auto-transporter adhesin, head GIN domain
MSGLSVSTRNKSPMRLSSLLSAVVLLFSFVPSVAQAAVLKPIKEDSKRAHFKPSDFTQLVIDGSTDVTLKQSTDNEVVLDASAQMRERIEVVQEGPVLRIKMIGGWRFWDSGNTNVTIAVSFKTLEEIRMSGAGNLSGKGKIKLPKLLVRLSGAGDVDFEDIHADELRLSLAGAGDARLRGITKEFSVSMAGAGSFHGENLKGAKGKVSIAGAGDAKVWATEELSVSIAGAGSVDYWGRPKSMKQSIAGVGSISDKGEK